jgi:hypothetical protein
MSIEKLTIVRVNRTTTDKNGNPLIWAAKKPGDKETPYTRVSLITKEYGDKKWIGGAVATAEPRGTDKWKEGDSVEVEISVNGDFTNFKLPTKSAQGEEKIKMLEGRVWQLETEMAQVQRSLTAANLLLKKTQYPTANNNPAAIDNAYEVESAKRAAAADAEAKKKEAQEALKKAQAAVAEYDSGEITMDDFPSFADNSNEHGN